MTKPSINPVDSWLVRLRGRVYEQFKGKPAIDSIVQALARQADASEAMWQQLAAIWSIDDNVGEQLKRIGRLVGQLHAGESDATYRQYLRARILANRSRGLVNDLLAVVDAMVGGGSSARVTMSPTATVVVRLLSPTLDPIAALVFASLLRAATEAGVGVIGEYQPTTTALAFAFDGGASGLGFADAGLTNTAGALAGALRR